MQMEDERHSHTPGYLPPPGAGGGRGRVGAGPGAVGSRGALQRKGKLMRGGSKERQRLPHPAPRTNKIKNQHTRCVHHSRALIMCIPNIIIIKNWFSSIKRKMDQLV